MLNDAERSYLDRAAWESVRHALTGEPVRSDPPESDRLNEVGSAFVTLMRKGRLRGCIGLIGERLPLTEAVREAARRSLTDPRFAPVTEEELSSLDLSISVLGPFTPVGSPEEIEVGRHGLHVTDGARSGLLLPQVATEQGWDRDTFLSQVCRKAGLPADRWRDPSVELMLFEADVF